jgi:hypothetical protein
MAKKLDEEAEVIAYTRVRDEGAVVRGRLPAPVVKASAHEGLSCFTSCGLQYRYFRCPRKLTVYTAGRVN